jgi:glycosyltransferase involved in cell wall biosynthesis
MIYFDVTKSARARHASGLMRVNLRLQDKLGAAITPVVWGRDTPAWQPDDWYLTTEVFDVTARPGFEQFLKNPPCRTAALFPDAIPLQHPKITWPHSVARHPRYMKLLAEFHHVFGISEVVNRDLEGFWQWQGVSPRAKVSAIPLGADFDSRPRHDPRVVVPRPILLCVGIVEPRKNQTFLMDVAESLWREGLEFELHVVGRVNPYFGAPIVERFRAMGRQRAGFHFHEAASDDKLAELLASTRAVVFPTIAEGCGLPVLESLWRGLPCVCSDLPVLRENTEDGGCVVLPMNDLAAWTAGLRAILTDDVAWLKLAKAAGTRQLPTWGDTARIIQETLSADSG